jgi:Effector-associated domain 11/Peptidase S24-like
MKKMLLKDSSKKKNITLVPMKAVGGNLTFSTETIRGFETFSIPGLYGELYAFEVEENSMTPNINHGDMVICREWNQQYDELRKDAAYVIITLDGAKVKRLERKYENHTFSQWTLISDNPTIPSDAISVADVTSIFLVVRVLSRYSISKEIENQSSNEGTKSPIREKFAISEERKEELRYKIANNRIKEVIKELVDNTDKSDDIYRNLFMLKSRIKTFILDSGSGCLSKEDEKTELNRITKALLDYIDLLD